MQNENQQAILTQENTEDQKNDEQREKIIRAVPNQQITHIL